MTKKLGIFLIRGAGKAGSQEQEQFVQKLNKTLQQSGVDPETIHYEYADWYGPTQANQERLLQRFLSSGFTLRNFALRKFVLFLISDMVAYVGEPNKPGNAYQQTHEQLHRSFTKLKDALPENAPLIVIASSLGTEIISNYISDRQNQQSDDPFGKSLLKV
jgi:hypothetical protein